MPDPEKGSFHIPGPKGPGVKVGEEFRFRLTPQAELELRVQCLERAIACCPFCCNKYAKELRSVGLEKLNMELPWGYQ
ncbi:hypothetical protein ES705_31270 [subsurface metagenome]|jgi:hypothetical protein